MKTILGFDASLVCSGFAYKDNNDEYHTGTIKTKKLRGPERLNFVEHSFIRIIESLYADTGSIDLIVYEDYAMGSKGKTFNIGELGGVLKLVAWDRGVDVLLVPPSNLKQFTTGKGNADKDKMMSSIADNWGYSVTQNDEADAFALLKMGEAYIATRKVRQAHKAKALQSCLLIKGRQSN